ncbi:hypothetical protein [Microbispora bryophytorum]|uniref:DUF2273 domain-containing protein n=2 Tax=Microbispora bryophytorum TaxID=1460882 RepID=A0A8H9H8A9_9ACTN|nr:MULTISPECIES: hypothetical protein [Microbispora]MBD3140426.1 hypothetical protein [Microbispora bryophytorum]MBD3146251.1 hypothetical protein [Microbispora camponoti]TQS02509.1 hypothetical protein FLX07_28475 [Microbispora bryophytorum]GGO27891.1 hypothetical protein GCM10011574_61730 [Microbispora bryophytorum]
MQGYPVWGIAGLLFGTVLGVVGAFGGLSAFIIVLVLGIVGFLVGLVLEGGVHLPQMHPRRQ